MTHFALCLAGLWFTIICLTIITSISLISTFVRSDCRAASVPSHNFTAAFDVDPTTSCSLAELISSMVLENISYFQSFHAIAFQASVTFSLLVFKPVLRAFVWSSLNTEKETKLPSLRLLRNRIQLSTSPGLVSGLADSWTSRYLTSTTSLVIFFSILSTIIPIAISPIYREHAGALPGYINIRLGGGVGLNAPPVYRPDEWSPDGLLAGRALVNSATLANTSLSSFSYSPTVLPFLDLTQIPKIASATIETVVAYQSLDCGPSAPLRYGTPNQLVSISSDYWIESVRAANISVGGLPIGLIQNDPRVSALYFNGTTVSSPGWTNSTSSVVLLAANGTIDGAQQRIVAPSEADSRIGHIDVLTCTSTTSLGISACVISNGRFRSCTPLSAEQLAAASLNNAPSIIETQINNPNSTSMFLSVSPVAAYISNCGYLPMYNDINSDLISANVLPLPSLTAQTYNNGYQIPLSYVTNALFSGTNVGLVLGMNSPVANWSTIYDQPADLIVIFATSLPELQAILLIIAVGGAMTMTLGALRVKSHNNVELDLIRLLAISRNSQLDDALIQYADLTKSVPDTFERYKVRYGHVSCIGRRALSLLPPEKSASMEKLPY